MRLEDIQVGLEYETPDGFVKVFRIETLQVSATYSFKVVWYDRQDGSKSSTEHVATWREANTINN